jgi:hypothetical protein
MGHTAKKNIEPKHPIFSRSFIDIQSFVHGFCPLDKLTQLECIGNYSIGSIQEGSLLRVELTCFDTGLLTNSVTISF